MYNHIDKSIHPDLFSSPVQQRALLLGRDGVINVNYGYGHHSENFELIDQIFEMAQPANARVCRLVVITNQAGIAAGIELNILFTQEQTSELTCLPCQVIAPLREPLPFFNSSSLQRVMP